MAIWQIEKLGGLANFGGARSRIRSIGQFDTSTLDPAEQETVEALFRKPPRAAKPKGADGFRYRITRSTESGTETIEVPESSVPPAIASSVKDQLI